jgi:hypothetical protein
MKKIFGIQRLICAAALLAPACALPAQDAGPTSTCDRDCMEGYANAYAAALVKHDATGLPLADNVHVTENGQPSSIDAGVWTTAVKFYSTPGSTQYVVDRSSGQVAMMGVIDVGVPAMYAVRLKIENGKITEIENLVKREADVGGPFQPEGYLWREAPYIRTIPTALHTSRDALAHTADTYWRVTTTIHKGEAVPYTVDCVHMENGMNTDWERPLSNWEAADPKDNPVSSFDGRIWTCAREATLSTVSWHATRLHRRLIDEERGLVMDWNLVDRDGPGFQVPKTLADGTPSTPPKYGPPSRGPDGWPTRAGMLGPIRSMTVGSSSTDYQAQLFRIVNGKIAREQVFWISLPPKVASPF